MIAGRVKPPKCALRPQRCVGKWKILGRLVLREPDSPKTVWRGEQRIIGNVTIIIPNEIPMPGRLVGEHGGRNQQKTEEPASTQVKGPNHRVKPLKNQ